MRFLRIGLVAIALLLVMSPAHAANAPVAIKDVAYQPATINVHPGDTVVWTHNDGSTPHSVTSDAGSGEAFDSSPTCPASGCMTQGEVFTHTFNTIGTFAYHCRVHSSMHGTVIVAALATTTTTTIKPTTTTARPAVTTTVKKATTTTSSFETTTTEFLDLSTTTSEESTTSTTEGQVAIKTKSSGSNGAALVVLILAIAGVLGGGGYALYRLRRP